MVWFHLRARVGRDEGGDRRCLSAGSFQGGKEPLNQIVREDLQTGIHVCAIGLGKRRMQPNPSARKDSGGIAFSRAVVAEGSKWWEKSVKDDEEDIVAAQDGRTLLVHMLEEKVYERRRGGGGGSPARYRDKQRDLSATGVFKNDIVQTEGVGSFVSRREWSGSSKIEYAFERDLPAAVRGRSQWRWGSGHLRVHGGGGGGDPD